MAKQKKRKSLYRALMNEKQYSGAQDYMSKNPHEQDKIESISNKEIKEFAKRMSSDLEVSKMLANITKSGSYQPQVGEQQAQDMNFNPLNASTKELESWLENPKRFDKEIRGLSHYLENTVGQYKRTMWYYNTIKSFNYELLPCSRHSYNKHKDNSKDDKKEFVNSYYRCLALLQKMNIKNNFPAMDLATLQDGASFYWITETEDSFNFLQLPPNHCFITGRYKNIGWTGAINLAYFDTLISTKNIAPELAEAYKHFCDIREQEISGKTLFRAQYYALPIDKTWIFTCNPTRSSKIPFMAENQGAMLDVLSYRTLLKDKSLLDSWQMLAMKMPLNSANVPSISYDLAGDIVDIVQETIPENVSAFATPFDVTNVTSDQTSMLDKISDIGDKNAYASLGVQGGIMGKETNSAKAYQIGMEIDFAYCSTHMYAQFNNMVNFLLQQRVRGYKWHVRFSGNKLTKDADIKSAMGLVTQANFPISHLASVVGYEPYEFESLIELENIIKLKENTQPLESQYQQSGKDSGDKESGKPSQGENISDAGEKTRQYEEDRKA